jgi:hypothetical protein
MKKRHVKIIKMGLSVNGGFECIIYCNVCGVSVTGMDSKPIPAKIDAENKWATLSKGKCNV